MKKNIEVFDFNEEDELAESASGKLLEKFTNPSPSNSLVVQCHRIQSSCQDKLVQKGELEGASCPQAATAVLAEAEESTRDHLFETDVDHDNHGLMFGLNTEDHLKETNVAHGLENFPCQPSAKYLYAKNSSYQPQLNSPPSDSSSSQEQTDMMSDIDESLSDRSAMSEASDSEDDEDWMAEHYFDDMEKLIMDPILSFTRPLKPCDHEEESQLLLCLFVVF